jgi:hypothetical protein
VLRHGFQLLEWRYPEKWQSSRGIQWLAVYAQKLET